jgi:phage terminase small subunit
MTSRLKPPANRRTRLRAAAIAPADKPYTPDVSLVHAQGGDDAPADLSPDSQSLWRRIVDEASFVFEAHHYAQLAIACAATDRAAEARRGVRQAGQLITGRYGSTINPLVAVERESQRTILRALAALRLDAPPADPSPRRPGPKGGAS